jgi:hypothetical protein
VTTLTVEGIIDMALLSFGGISHGHIVDIRHFDKPASSHHWNVVFK